MKHATSATDRVSLLIKAALASTLPSSAKNIIAALQSTLAAAEEGITRVSTLQTPQIQQTADDGTVLEQHEEAQVQRTSDGKTVARFASLLPAASDGSGGSGGGVQVVVVVPADPKKTPTLVQVGEVGKEEQVQFEPNGGDVALFRLSGETVQIPSNGGGGLVVKMVEGDVVQVLPSAASIAKMNANTANTETASNAVARFLDASTSDSYSFVLHFQSDGSGDLKGCIFGEKKLEGSALLQFPADDEVDKACYWNGDERLVVVFRDGAMCERSHDGRVVVAEKLDAVLQAAMSSVNLSGASAVTNGSSSNDSSDSSSSPPSSSSGSTAVDDIDFDNGNKVEIVQSLKRKQLEMTTQKHETESKIKAAHEAYTAASILWTSASAAKSIADLARFKCMEIATHTLEEEGTVSQEQVEKDGSKIIIAQLKSGTQRQIQLSADGTKKTINVAMSNQEQVVEDNPEIQGCMFQQIETSDVDNIALPMQTIVMLKSGPHSGTQVCHTLKNGVTESVIVARDGRRVHFKVKRQDKEGEPAEVVEGVTVENENSAVQISVLTEPRRIAVVYDNGDVKFVQINHGKKNVGLVVMRSSGGVKKSLSSNGAFTVETAARDGGVASSAFQLGPDGHLLVVRQDGSQWRFTGTELHAMQHVRVNSPRGKLQAAKEMDTALND